MLWLLLKEDFHHTFSSTRSSFSTVRPPQEIYNKEKRNILKIYKLLICFSGESARDSFVGDSGWNVKHQGRRKNFLIKESLPLYSIQRRNQAPDHCLVMEIKQSCKHKKQSSPLFLSPSLLIVYLAFCLQFSSLSN